MKKHKKERYESSKYNKRRDKAKKKKKYKELENTINPTFHKIVDNETRYYSSPKIRKAENIYIDKLINKKNISTEVEYSTKNHINMKKIKNPVTKNKEKNSFSIKSSNKLSSFKNYDTVKMTNSFLDSNLEHRVLKKKKILEQENIKTRSRSISKSKFNLYYCKHKTKGSKRSTSYDNNSLKNKIISCKYKKSISSDKTFQVSYTERNNISPDVTDSSKNCSEKVEDINPSKSKYMESRQLTFSLLQKHHEHYRDILQEVKKILRNDVNSKRKLKYIFKRQQIYMHTPFIKIQSSKSKKFCLLENNIKEKNIKEKMKLNSLECYHTNIATKNNKKFCNICITPVKSIIKESKVLCSKTNLYNKKLSSTFISNINNRSNISERVSSPTQLLVTNKEKFNTNLAKTKLHQLSLISKINVSGNSSKYDLKLCDNLENSDMLSKYFNIEKNSSNTSNLTHQSSKILSNSLLSDNSKDITFSKNKDINVKETISFYQLSSSSQSTTYSQAITPLKNCNTSTSWPQIFLLQNNASNLVLKENVPYLKNNTEELIDTITSPLKTSPVSESSNSQTSQLKHCFKNFHRKYKTKSRSLSFSKSSRSLSRSLSSTSEDIRNRSRSKSTNYTYTSSVQHSRSTSWSSQSTIKSNRNSSFNSSRSRSTSIPRRHGSPSFLDRRRITSARKRPIPYHRSTPSSLSSKSSACRSNYSMLSPQSFKSSDAPSCSSPYIII